jgi:hypothetical protein
MQTTPRPLCALLFVVMTFDVVDDVMKPECQFNFARIGGFGAQLVPLCEALFEVLKGVIVAMGFTVV